LADESFMALAAQSRVVVRFFIGEPSTDASTAPLVSSVTSVEMPPAAYLDARLPDSFSPALVALGVNVMPFEVFDLASTVDLPTP